MLFPSSIVFTQRSQVTLEIELASDVFVFIKHILIGILIGLVSVYSQVPVNADEVQDIRESYAQSQVLESLYPPVTLGKPKNRYEYCIYF